MNLKDRVKKYKEENGLAQTVFAGFAIFGGGVFGLTALALMSSKARLNDALATATLEQHGWSREDRAKYQSWSIQQELQRSSEQTPA